MCGIDFKTNSKLTLWLMVFSLHCARVNLECISSSMRLTSQILSKMFPMENLFSSELMWYPSQGGLTCFAMGIPIRILQSFKCQGDWGYRFSYVLGCVLPSDVALTTSHHHNSSACVKTISFFRTPHNTSLVECFLSVSYFFQGSAVESIFLKITLGEVLSRLFSTTIVVLVNKYVCDTGVLESKDWRSHLIHTALQPGGARCSDSMSTRRLDRFIKYFCM